MERTQRPLRPNVPTIQNTDSRISLSLRQILKAPETCTPKNKPSSPAARIRHRRNLQVRINRHSLFNHSKIHRAVNKICTIQYIRLLAGSVHDCFIAKWSRLKLVTSLSGSSRTPTFKSRFFFSRSRQQGTQRCSQLQWRFTGIIVNFIQYITTALVNTVICSFSFENV